MGYFGAGFVFVRSPDWKKVDDIPDDLCLRAYQYRHGQVWLLDFWQRSRHEHRNPFVDAKDYRGLMQLRADDTVRAFDQICERLESEAAVYGGGWLRLSLAMGRQLGQKTFFFAADDERLNMACHSDSDGISRIFCRFDPYDIHYEEEHWRIIPQRMLEDVGDEERWSEQVLADVGALPGVEVTSPVDVDGGQRLFEYPVKEWPREAGDPVKVLGIGTWEVFNNVQQDFTVVFERLPRQDGPHPPAAS